MSVAASLTANAAADRRWDAVVVGAGPAGSVAARGLAQRGQETLLVDRAEFPRWKVCGCCLNGAALAALEAAGLGSLAADCGGRPLGEIRLASRGRSAVLPLGRSVVLSREALDAALVRSAVAAGAAFLPRTTVTLGSQLPDSRELLLDAGGSAVTTWAGVVIAADGPGGKLLARSDPVASLPTPGARVGAGVVADDVPEFYRPGTIYMACGEGGYAGLVRLEDGRLDVAAALDVGQVRAGHGPGPAVARLVGEAGWPVPPGFATLNWKGTPPLTRKARRLAAGRVFAVGDAAGYVEPFTGEGIARALAAGLAVVPVAARPWCEASAREWAVTFRRVVRRQVICRVAAGVLRRPWLVRAAIGMLTLAPALAAPVVRGLNAPLPRTWQDPANRRAR